MVPILLALAAAMAAEVPVLDVRGGIDPGVADYVVEGLRDAEAAGAPAVVIRLDTPGGLLESAREIVAAELAAEVPVIVWVGPSGARAASAGVFLTLGAHVAAMAPGTTIGAAHPVVLGGEQPDGPMAEKMVSDAAAWARAVATQRGRDADWAEQAVRESVSVTDDEALELGLIDLAVADLPALLDAADGLTVLTAAGPVTLDTADAALREVPMDLRQRVVHVLGDPNVLYALMLVGMLGIYVELSNPGLVLPGVLGAVALIAAGVGLSILPFNAGGLLLVLLGLALLIAEVFVVSSGALALGGVVSVVLGGLLLFDVAGFDLSVDPWVLGLVGVVGAALAVLVAVLVARAQRRPPLGGAEGLVGEAGEVLEGGHEHGRVRVAGETWWADWRGDLRPGERVRVTGVHGLHLDVEPQGGGP